MTGLSDSPLESGDVTSPQTNSTVNANGSPDPVAVISSLVNGTPATPAPAAVVTPAGQAAPAPTQATGGKMIDKDPSSVMGFGDMYMDANRNVVRQRPGIIGGLLEALVGAPNLGEKMGAQRMAAVQGLTGTQKPSPSQKAEIASQEATTEKTKQEVAGAVPVQPYEKEQLAQKKQELDISMLSAKKDAINKALENWRGRRQDLEKEFEAEKGTKSVWGTLGSIFTGQGQQLTPRQIGIQAELAAGTPYEKALNAHLATLGGGNPGGDVNKIITREQIQAALAARKKKK